MSGSAFYERFFFNGKRYLPPIGMVYRKEKQKDKKESK